MNTLPTQHKSPESDLVRLVLTALDQKELAGLSAVLQCIAEAVNAFGCILWEAAPGADLNSQPPQGHLSILAEWFQDGRIIALYDIPLDDSANGLAVLQGEPVWVADLQPDPRAFRNEVTIKAGFQTLCAVPVEFHEGQARYGSVCVYRLEAIPFTVEETALIAQMAALVPGLYQAIQNAVSQRLIAGVNNVLHDADVKAKERLLAKEDVQAIFSKLCHQVSATFQCLETSIFMRDEAEAASEYGLVATTLPSWIPPTQTYHPELNDGLTGWVLAQTRAVSIFDLEKFERDAPTIQAKYPGLKWKDKWGLRKKVRDVLGQKEEKPEAPPLGFMAVPVFRGTEVLGVVRCSIVKRGPYYFSKREVELLEQVATQVGRYWANWQTRRRVEDENQVWQGLVASVEQLNDFVRNELRKPVPDETRIFKEALRVSDAVISRADTINIRLLDEDTQQLYYAEVSGGAWEQLSSAARTERLARRFSLRNDAEKSLGKYVYQTRQVYMTNYVDKDPHYAKDSFLGATRAIVAPLLVGDNFYGVLDLRSKGEKEFTDQDKHMADLLGRQLGLYRYLTEVIGQLRQAENDLKSHQAVLERSVEVQRQTYQDLAHQLKSPIVQAQARIQNALAASSIDFRNLESVRSLCRRARRVTMNLGLFAALASDEPVKVAPTPLRYRSLVRLLEEAARDQEIALDPSRLIRFRVQQRGLEVVNLHEVKVDLELLEHALNNILDNAGKYSFEQTTVFLSGGLTRRGKFHLTVANRGLPVRTEYVNKVKERGWRSPEAEWTTGEGQGVGLWIVDHIMQAHEGELIVSPTDAHGMTEVKLIFPVLGG